jgi:hypothetical protein
MPDGVEHGQTEGPHPGRPDASTGGSWRGQPQQQISVCFESYPRRTDEVIGRLTPVIAGGLLVVNLHGLGDHSGLYPNLGSYFPARGIAVYGYDMGGIRLVAGRTRLRPRLARVPGRSARVPRRVREWKGNLPLSCWGIASEGSSCSSMHFTIRADWPA